MPGTDGNIGKLAAFDVRTMKEMWSYTQRAPFLTAVDLDGGRRGVRRRPRSPVPGLRREDRRDPVGNAAVDVRAGLPGDVQRRRQAVPRGDDRQRRRQSAGGAGDDRAGAASAGDGQRALRVRAARQIAGSRSKSSQKQNATTEETEGTENLGSVGSCYVCRVLRVLRGGVFPSHSFEER